MVMFKVKWDVLKRLKEKDRDEFLYMSKDDFDVPRIHMWEWIMCCTIMTLWVLINFMSYKEILPISNQVLTFWVVMSAWLRICIWIWLLDYVVQWFLTLVAMRERFKFIKKMLPDVKFWRAWTL